MSLPITFDDVLPRLATICEEQPDFGQVAVALVVRDLRGRVRLVFQEADPSFDSGPLRLVLAQRLKSAMPHWFGSDERILSVKDPAPDGKLAKLLLAENRANVEDWEPEMLPDEITGTAPLRRARWKKLERSLSKEAWLRDAVQPPWNQQDGPKIATFYSFKGGVGRTTALISCALQLSLAGERVLLLDLDLEAPGLGSTLKAEGRRGLLDYLVDFCATKSGNFTDLVQEVQGEPYLRVVPAGKLEPRYLEKLARLDFTGSSGDPPDQQAPPTEQGLKILLQRLNGNSSWRPDWILIDSRAGLHDLAGLSLHGLAHVDVLVGRASEQGYRGLDLTVQMLYQKRKDTWKPLIVHTMAPPSMEERELQAREFRARSFEIFQNVVYRTSDTDAAELSASLPHYPHVVGREEILDRNWDFWDDRVREALLKKDYRDLLKRLMECFNVVD